MEELSIYYTDIDTSPDIWYENDDDYGNNLRKLPSAFGKRAQYRPTKPIGNPLSPPSSNKGNTDRPGLEKLEHGPSNTRQGLKRTQSATSMHGMEGSFQRHRGNKRLSQPSTSDGLRAIARWLEWAHRPAGIISTESRCDHEPLVTRCNSIRYRY
ncbi:hypothetical protein I312_101938 [Cryptococcus bacillisporus CA1280]|uniref:uncharacterized protein n=1 Tax=Cryptococcus bacillisporus CA1280 TaxID=1296109 RepID=UPI0033681B6A